MVSPWKVGARWIRDSTSRLAMAIPLTSGTLMPSARESHRSDMTGADRKWAARYNPGEIVQYTTGSKSQGIDRDSFAIVRAVDARAKTLTVDLDSGSTVTYDPRRLRGVNR